jgi:hypothetical protein
MILPKTVSASFFFAILSIAPIASARLGESEAQAQTRYGAPTPELAFPSDKPLLPGAKEVIYNFQGWRVRAAFVNDVTVRIEYAHLPENNAPKQISEPEVKTILDAEKGKFSWREQKPRTGYQELNALKALFDGRVWERSDHAQAKLKYKLLFELETRDADTIEKKLAKQLPASTPPTATSSPGPKF